MNCHHGTQRERCIRCITLVWWEATLWRVNWRGALELFLPQGKA
jgi:hypothetical protein